MKTRAALLAACAVALAAGSAGANTIYSNGAYNGSITGFSILNGFYSTADSFTAAPGSVARSVNFVTWDDPGAALTSVTWSIYDGNPFTGSPTLLGSGTVAPTAVSLGSNGLGYDLYSNTISFTGVTLSAGGTYWLELSNGIPSDAGIGGNVFWDDNNGPSAGWQGGAGGDGDLSTFDPIDFPGTNSEAFTIFDTAGVPEPAAWALMLVGFAALGAALRSRRSRPAAA